MRFSTEKRGGSVPLPDPSGGDVSSDEQAANEINSTSRMARAREDKTAPDVIYLIALYCRGQIFS